MTTTLNQELTKIYDWYSANKLTLSNDKTNAILFSNLFQYFQQKRKKNQENLFAFQEYGLKHMLLLYIFSLPSRIFINFSLPFSALCKFNILKFLNHYKHGLLPNNFKSDFIFVYHMKRAEDLLSRNTFFLPRVNLEKIRKLPP